MNYPFNYDAIPDYMQVALIKYVNNGRPVGDFLTALMSNDLRGACGNADDTNLPLIPVYNAWLYNRAPGGCYGSPEKVRAWIDQGGLGDNSLVDKESFISD